MSMRRWVALAAATVMMAHSLVGVAGPVKHVKWWSLDTECDYISWHVEGLTRADGDPHAYAEAAAMRVMNSGTDIVFLGGDSRGFYVLESFSPIDSGCEPMCTQLRIREVRFDGRRYLHDFHHTLSATEWKPEKPASAVRSFLERRAPRLRPIPFEVNPSPRKYMGSHSGWLFRVRDHLHRKTYLWRQHTGHKMCWCTLDLRMSTVVWGGARSRK